MRLALALVVCGSLCSSAALADERFDHRGAVGLLVGAGLEHYDVVGGVGGGGLLLDADLGATYAVGYNGNELTLLLRGGFLGPHLDAMIAFGYRGYFGRERIKTFVDFGLSAHSMPLVTLGPRVGFGVQYELSEVVGFYFGTAAQLGFSSVIRFDAELLAGVQIRSYLLE